MTHPSRTAARRRGPTVAMAAAAGLALAAGISVTAVTPASAAASPSGAGSIQNPYDPAYQHPYRHGALPTIGQLAKMKAYDAAHPQAVTATGPETLAYGGGIDGIGVMDGHAKVYTIFYGTQWGTETTAGNGDLTFSSDPDGAAQAAQDMFKGIGTGNELWSATLTQWCDGPNVSSGATSCPSNASFVPYMTGGVFAGAWYDNSGAEPDPASGNQLGTEAVNAAAHFGNTTAASNRDAYYVILSATGTNPDNYQGAYCAWHDYTGDSSLTGGAVSSPYGDIAFSNQPYNIDSGAGCGVGFINSPGTTDGFTITLGHEFAETMSDQNPAGGWTNQQTGSSYSGQENGDECAWISPGTAGGAGNVTMGNGTYAEQATWSNDTNECDLSHAILNHGGNTVTVNNPGSQSGKVGTAVSLQISATDSGGAALTYSATGLPAGLSISSSGLISGTPTTATSYSTTVTAKDTTGASGSATFSWTISSNTGNTVTVTSPGNQSSTVGTAVSLQIHATDSASGQTLTYSATGLPAGLSINSSSGLISGTPTTATSYSTTVTAKDTTGASGSASFTWTVGSSSGGCTAAQLLGNPGFETGSAAPWTSTSGVIEPVTAGEPSHSGNYLAWLDGYGVPTTDTLAQTVTIPSTCKNATFSYWWYIDTSELTSVYVDDTLTVQVLNSSGTVLKTLHTYSNLDADNVYSQASFSLNSYIGQKITLKFTGTETDLDYGTTDFLIDDTGLNVS